MKKQKKVKKPNKNAPLAEKSSSRRAFLKAARHAQRRAMEAKRAARAAKLQWKAAKKAFKQAKDAAHAAKKAVRAAQKALPAAVREGRKAAAAGRGARSALPEALRSYSQFRWITLCMNAFDRGFRAARQVFAPIDQFLHNRGSCAPSQPC
jgi:hypothetical protein